MGLIKSKASLESNSSEFFYSRTDKISHIKSVSAARKDLNKQSTEEWKLVRVIDAKVFTLADSHISKYKFGEYGNTSYSVASNSKQKKGRSQWKEMNSIEARKRNYQEQTNTESGTTFPKQIFPLKKVKMAKKIKDRNRNKQIDENCLTIYKNTWDPKSERLDRTNYVRKYVDNTRNMDTPDSMTDNNENDYHHASILIRNVRQPNIYDGECSRKPQKINRRKDEIQRNDLSAVEVTPSLIQNGNSVDVDTTFVKTTPRRNSKQKQASFQLKKSIKSTDSDNESVILPCAKRGSKKEMSDEDEEQIFDSPKINVFPTPQVTIGNKSHDSSASKTTHSKRSQPQQNPYYGIQSYIDPEKGLKDEFSEKGMVEFEGRD